jgi:Family of unknown function (DUF6776)
VVVALDRSSRLMRDQRRRKLVITLCATLLLAVVLAAGFYLGQRAAYSGMGRSPGSYRALQVELAAVKGALELRNGELDVQRTRHDVDRSALELVRREIASQKEQIAALEEGLQFYRGLMAPDETDQGLSLYELELIPGKEPRQYAFRIVIQQQAARKHALVKGELRAAVFGVLDSEQVEYSLAELSDDIDGDAIELVFRYFQAIEGEIILPQGFEPGGMRLVATARSPRKLEVREEFSWQLQERFTHVGK